MVYDKVGLAHWLWQSTNNKLQSPLALAVWNNVTKTILLAKEVELGA